MTMQRITNKLSLAYVSILNDKAIYDKNFFARSLYALLDNLFVT
jgi:hypothetical protein